LIYGDYEDIDPKDAKVFSYARSMDGTRYLVILNMSSEQLNYTLPQMLNPGRFMIGKMEDPVTEVRNSSCALGKREFTNAHYRQR